MELMIVTLILAVVYLAYRLDETASKRRDSGEQWQ